MSRVVSGAGLGGAVVAAVWWLPSLVLLGIAETTLIAAFVEYSRLADRFDIQVHRIPGCAAAMLTCAAMVAPGMPVPVVLMAAFVALGALVLAFGRSHMRALHEVAASLLPALYLGLPLGSLVAIHAEIGRTALLLLLMTVIVSDTAQYYAGRALGRRLLAPDISPKKTLEGALGGLVFGSLMMAVAGQWWLPMIGPVSRGALGFAVVIVGIVGDLFESLLKRGAGVKDASSLIPGHGGVLDRIDALLFAAPVYYVFVKYSGQ
jgi:phosphatidate cytidylyltransferase